MIDNKNLSEAAKASLRDLTYSSKVTIWEKYCSDCPFKIYRFVKYKDSRYSVDITKSNENDCHAQYLEFDNSKIVRGCGFGGEELSLDEVVANTCRFWKVTTDEGGVDNPDNKDGCFIEITDFKEMKKIGHQHI